MACPNLDLNLLNTNSFILTIERLPKVSFFSQSVILPSLSLGELEQPTPLTRISIPADQLQWTALQVTFAVDAQMNNYIEIFNWMVGLGFPEDHSQYSNEMAKRTQVLTGLPTNYSDGSLIIIDKNGNSVRTFSFVDTWPMSLEGITFATTNADVQYATSTLVLGYTHFKII